MRYNKGSRAADTVHECVQRTHIYISDPTFVFFPVLLFVSPALQFPPFPSLPRTSDQRMLSPLTSTHLSAQMVNIPVLVIRNETGHRIMEEILENRRNVMIFSHAGDRPSR